METTTVCIVSAICTLCALGTSLFVMTYNGDKKAVKRYKKPKSR